MKKLNKNTAQYWELKQCFTLTTSWTAFTLSVTITVDMINRHKTELRDSHMLTQQKWARQNQSSGLQQFQEHFQGFQVFCGNLHPPSCSKAFSDSILRWHTVRRFQILPDLWSALSKSSQLPLHKIHSLSQKKRGYCQGVSSNTGVAKETFPETKASN